MQGSIRRPRVSVSYNDISDLPATFPPTPSEVSNIIGTDLDVNTATSGQVLSFDGAGYDWVTVTSGGSPGGSTTQIQYNNAGAFAGSADLTYDGTNLDLLTPSGSVRIGDGAGSGHGTSINLASNQVAFQCGGSFRFTITTTYMYVTSPASTVEIGDPEGFGNSTRLIVDDANERATFNKKAVITDTGSLYIYDAGTSTYWKWESVSGVWTGTDTTSASLP